MKHKRPNDEIFLTVRIRNCQNGEHFFHTTIVFIHIPYTLCRGQVLNFLQRASNTLEIFFTLPVPRGWMK